MTPFDPIPTADDICEILHDADWASQRAELTLLVKEAGTSLSGVLVEVARQGFLSRLLPTAPSQENADAVAALLAGTVDATGASLLADVWIARGEAYDAVCLNQLLPQAAKQGSLPSLFAHVIDGGQYDAMRAVLTADGMVDSPALRALAAARPTYNQTALNAATLAALAKPSPATPFDLLIVPGYTPVDATKPMKVEDLSPACRRLDLAIADLAAGKARALLFSGGCVHPPGTPHNEALSMRDYALGKKVAPERILVEPFARHSTTNLRNAGRMMRALNLPRGLIATGFDEPAFDQAFYFSEPILSTFDRRCQEELGYLVGDLGRVDAHHVSFSPAADVETLDYRDPLDP